MYFILRMRWGQWFTWLDYTCRLVIKFHKHCIKVFESVTTTISKLGVQFLNGQVVRHVLFWIVFISNKFSLLSTTICFFFFLYVTITPPIFVVEVQMYLKQTASLWMTISTSDKVIKCLIMFAKQLFMILHKKILMPKRQSLVNESNIWNHQPASIRYF